MHGCDWSSDVCSSDLTVGLGEVVACYGLGMLLLWRLSKSTALQNYLKNR